MSKNRYKLFFSWQSEDTKSRKVLEKSLQDTIKTLGDKGIVLEIDHSTLGESGLPSIDQTILRKIDSCDIFLADITPVCNYKVTLGNGTQVTKEVPNPNVLLELGSGFSIATRDLSIRGAGDILGSKQAGFIDSVGIDLYLKMLNEEVERLKGNVVEEDSEEESNKTLLNVSTHISDDYVTDDDLKIMIHRMINEIDSKEKLEEVRSDLEDRFGKLSEDIIVYMYEEWFEKLVKQVGVTKVSETKNTIELYFDKESTSKLNTEDLFMNAYTITPMFRFKSRESDLTIILDIVKLEKHPIYYLVALLSSMVS